MRLKLAILASGSGSNAQAIMEAVKEKVLDADIKLVFTNKPDAPVKERAKNFGIPCECLSHKDFANREDFDTAMLEILEKYDIDTIAMAGYMRIVTPKVIKAYEGRILNVHPALLPSFPGAHGIEDAKKWGVKILGSTVHFVDEIMDNGAIIIQAGMPAAFINTEMFLDKFHGLEHKIYVQALRWLSEERLEIKGREVILHPPKDKDEEVKYRNPYINTIIHPPLEQAKKPI